MNKNIKSILKEKIKVHSILRNLNKKTIVKSILQNNNTKIKTKLYAKFILSTKTSLKNT